jgi:DNA-binding NarL/FixJ family response regulator
MIIVVTNCGLFKNGFESFRESYICDCTSFSRVEYVTQLDKAAYQNYSQVKAIIVDYEQQDISLLIALMEIKSLDSEMTLILMTREARFSNTIENILINTVADYALNCTDSLRKLELILRELHGCTQHKTIVKNTDWYRIEKASNLTRKEEVVLPYIVSGKNNKEISRYLNLSQKTISCHRRSIYEKFKVNNLIGLYNTFCYMK